MARVRVIRVNRVLHRAMKRGLPLAIRAKKARQVTNRGLRLVIRVGKAIKADRDHLPDMSKVRRRPTMAPVRDIMRIRGSLQARSKDHLRLKNGGRLRMTRVHRHTNRKKGTHEQNSNRPPADDNRGIDQRLRDAANGSHYSRHARPGQIVGCIPAG
jgi:hypothetical protein